MTKEFVAFMKRGNVIDMAVGVVMGAAFGKIVSTFTDNILMPPLGLVMGKVNFGDMFVSLNGQPYASLKAAEAAGAPVIAYGLFINTIINFVIVAFAMFMLISAFTRMTAPKPEPPAPATTKDCKFCYSSIHLQATRCPNCTSELGG